MDIGLNLRLKSLFLTQSTPRLVLMNHWSSGQDISQMRIGFFLVESPWDIDKINLKKTPFLFSLMLERLEHGPFKQKRCILLNLWRFYSKQKEVISVYLKYLDHEDVDLRFDALVLLGSVTEAKTMCRYIVNIWGTKIAVFELWL